MVKERSLQSAPFLYSVVSDLIVTTLTELALTQSVIFLFA